jgi:hypothetical protein
VLGVAKTKFFAWPYRTTLDNACARCSPAISSSPSLQEPEFQRGLKEAGYICDAGSAGAGHYVQVQFDGFDFPCRVTRRCLRICGIQPSIASNP